MAWRGLVRYGMGEYGVYMINQWFGDDVFVLSDALETTTRTRDNGPGGERWGLAIQVCFGGFVLSFEKDGEPAAGTYIFFLFWAARNCVINSSQSTPRVCS